jgi:hypothetical protein
LRDLRGNSVKVTGFRVKGLRISRTFRESYCFILSFRYKNKTNFVWQEVCSRRDLHAELLVATSILHVFMEESACIVNWQEWMPLAVRRVCVATMDSNSIEV